MVLHLDGSALKPTTALSSWNDTSGYGQNATQNTATLQPTVVANARFCYSAVQFQSKYLTVPNSPSLNPGLGVS